MSSQQQLTFSILIIGSDCVGKTSIIQQFIDSEINNTVTIGFEFSKKDVIINNQIVTLYLWSGPGLKYLQTRYMVNYLKKDCCIIVYDSNDTEPTITLDYWKTLYLEFSSIDIDDQKNIPFFVIQNDFEENNEIIKSYLVEQWCKQNRVKQFFKVSALDNKNIKQTFLKIAKMLLQQRQELMNMEKQTIDKVEEFPKVISFENPIMKQQLKCNMQEQIEQLQCYNQHDSPPIIVLLDDNLKGVQRLICSKCINNIKGRFNGINIDDAIQSIEESKNNYLNTISNFSQSILGILNHFKEEIIKEKNQILQTMDQMISQVRNWIDEIEQIEVKQCSYSFFEEIDKLNQSIETIRNQQIDEFKKVVRSINQSYETKIQFTKQLLLKQLLSAQNTLKLNQSISSFKQLNSEGKNVDVEMKSYHLLKYNLVQEVKQTELCYALAFNKNDTIMVASLNKNIKIWNFQQGQLLDKNTILDGHEKLIKCIVFSQKYNWFFSGSEDNTIRGWKEKQNWFSSGKWKSVEANKTHKNWVVQLILNEQENELISCSIDKTIKIWRISYDSNQIRFLESLEKHKEQILQISLSQSQKQLISWGQDKQVILWVKNQQSTWQFKNIILFQIQEINRGARFLMDNQIICTTSQGQLQSYRLEKDECQKQQVLSFDMQNSDQHPQEFSIIFNKQTQLIVMKHQKYFYFFRNNFDDCKFQQVCQPLECQKEVCFYNVTNNGKYFIVWICHPLLRFRVYELIYSNIQ